MQIRRILSRSLASPSTASQSLASPSLAASRPGAGRLAAVLLGFCLILGAAAQSPAPEAVSEAAAAAPSVPQQVRFSGQLASRAGETVEAVFRVYAAAEGGEPLWSETQRVAVDGDGGYTVLLGSSSAQGLPQALFAGGQARWLGVSVEQAAELPRAQLASVPYAMKSADAATLAGHAAAEFVTQAQLGALAEAGSAQPAAATPQVIEATPTGSGATGAVPLWTSSTTLGNSEIVQVGSEIGINNAAPAATLDVSGSTALRGVVAIPPAGVATTTVGSNSHQLEMSASSWSTTAAAPVQQNFAWLAAATGNNTASPGGVLDLQFGSGTNPLLATGFSISSNGHVNFASGQTYPGAGTITVVTPVSPITGGGASGPVSIGLSVTALEPLLNTYFARLNAGNDFVGAQSITGALSASLLTTAGGGLLSNGAVTAAPKTAATTAAAVSSPLLELQASAYSSTAAAAVPQNFAWQAVGSGNNTASPAANLTLLYGSGTSAPAATGLSIAPNGAITFSPSQSFPITGTGGGTITGITTSSPLTGSGASGSVALGLNVASLLSTLSPALITGITTSSPLTGGGSAGSIALGLDPNALTTVVEPLLQPALNATYAQLGVSNSFTTGQIINGASTIAGTNVSGSMLNVTNSGDSFSSAISAANSGQYGIGLEVTAAANGYGIEGFGTQTGGSIGVLGALANSSGFSSSFYSLESDDGLDAGLWADGADGQESALIATADDLYAGIFYNDSAASSTILVLNNSTGGPTGNVQSGIGTVLRAGGPGGSCGINQSGNIACTGEVKSLVTTPDGQRQVETYAVQSAENWIEDYGAGQLSNGSATITLDPAFVETVNTGIDFHVFLTPGADCQGLYVSHKTASSFEVHELGGGHGAVPFDYKIVAKRRGLEAQRLVDVTARMKLESDAATFKALDHPLTRRTAPRLAATPAR